MGQGWLSPAVLRKATLQIDVRAPALEWHLISPPRHHSQLPHPEVLLDPSMSELEEMRTMAARN